MDNRKYVVLHGLPGSGKDTICSFLEAWFHGETYRLADPVKKQVAQMLATSGVGNRYSYEYYLALLDDRLTKEVFRPLVKWYSTEFTKIFLGNPNYWIEQFEAQIKNSKSQFIFVPDCRFLNEYYHFTNKGAFFIKVKRDSCIPSDHVSDTEFPDDWFDFIVDNNGTYEELLCLLEQQVVPLLT